ncbi:MAG: hypothetical protein JWN03_172 [Nocardia sp.]|uniref:hypothetical protein n=1 Tax=Nocardia sp. TaxID=1821 RepID=UPI00261117DE|nr:hypothetical protein [Nocardia sp.]MCU1639897.1 hypothetical protein [Nocardia sp.]
MESGTELEGLRSALSCVYEKLDAESLTEPDSTELVARAEVIQDQIDAIQDAISNDEVARTRTPPAPPMSDRLF